jgi:putative nucleotidyltransferase with HDIG domain
MVMSRAVQTAEMPLALVDVPPFPAVALRALQLVSKEEGRLRDLNDLISSDQAIAAQLLRLTNSPLYGIRVEITSTLQATMLLGFERVKGLLLTIGIKSYLRDTLQLPALAACWRHSLACALVTEELAKLSLADKEVAYTAGLVHDLGRLALAIVHCNSYGEFVKSSEGSPCDVLVRERELFGIDHCEAGRALMTSWNLPQELIAVAAHHHGPRNGSKFDTLAAVRFSCMMSDTLGFHVARSIHTRTYQELLEELPAAERKQFPAEAEELASRIAGKIKSIEFV